MILPVYIPNDNAQLGCHILPASGMVGAIIEHTDLVRVYFEGNLHGACNLNTFLDRLTVAAGRCTNRAPTVAFTVVSKYDLSIVGEIDTENYTLKLFKPMESKLKEYIGDIPLSEPYKDYKVSMVS